jgi:hypothetical protein
MHSVINLWGAHCKCSWGPMPTARGSGSDLRRAGGDERARPFLAGPDCGVLLTYGYWWIWCMSDYCNVDA